MARNAKMTSMAQVRHATGGGRVAEDASRDTLPKMVFDRAAAAAGLIVLAPVFLAVILWMLVRDRGPVLFAHARIGKAGRRFHCLKFRTMRPDASEILARHLAGNRAAAAEWAATRKLRDDPRVTPLGRVLRRSSLDELPQLLNILRGEMSLVGPRPITDDEMRHYGSAMRDYLSVRPGLTGLWQVSGRSDIGYAERVQLDRAYVRNRTFLQDIAILWRTVGVVARRKGSF
jgi:exopolysaccharide production protein ExoY